MLQKSTQEAPSSVERSSRILRSLSHASVNRLTDIAQATGLGKATVSRILDVLIREGFVIRDPKSKCYRLGPEMLLLGVAALKRFDPKPLVQPSFLRLSGIFEDTVILSIPSGVESLCVEIMEGRYPIRANYLTVGSRRPLGVGAGSLALLAWMPEEERRSALEVIGPQLGKWYPRVDATMLEDLAQQSLEQGYALMLEMVVERMGGIAVPLLGVDNRPVGAISIAALSDRIVSRQAELVKALQKERRLCEVLWSDASMRTSATPERIKARG